MANQQISYTTRDFQGIRQELINYVKQYYPELIDNFNDASVFSVLMDLNAAVADNLHFHIDRSIQETVLQYAQQRSSVYNIARTYGLKIPGQRPSVALTDFSITVPAFGDKEDERYLGVLRRGSQVYGSGQVFENITDIDFASPFNAEGFPNRLKIPNFDANNNLINYTIVKREIVVNGITKVFKRVITPNDVRPFFELFLPEKNVLGVTSIIQRQGTNYSNVPSASEFLSPVGKWYEVDALADNRVFVADITKASDQPGIKVGRYIQTEQRFITEYTSEGFMKLTFGGGTNTAEDQLRQFTSLGIPMNLAKYQNNFALGTTPQPNTTMFIQYRVGGGLGTNLGINTINTIGTVNFFVNGPSENINTQVINSLRCNNVTAAIGGAGYPTTDEVRNFVTFNFAAQNRAVTVADYQAIIQKMPSEFGAPAKVSIVENDNKINIQIVSYDTNGSLTEVVSNTLKQNIAEYLSNYRMMNDYVSVQVANVIDLSLEIEVILDATQNQGSVITNIVDKVYNEHFNPLSRGLGDNVYLANIMRTIQNENGVINVGSIKFFNLVGGQYSSSQTSQPYSNSTTKQIGLVDGVIFAQPNQIYQVRFPEKDILVRVKNYTSTTVS